jgi:hypothetical protein
MNTHLKPFRLRLDRARKHLEDFERKSTRFTNSRPYEVVTEIDNEGVNQILRYKLQGGKKLPPNLSFIAGDCIHNLRSILDNLVWQLGNLSGCSKTKLRIMGFPACITPQGFAGELNLLSCLPQAAIDIIESLQPYQPYKGRNEPYSHPLWILNRLWNDDKHRTPILVVAFHAGTGFSPKGGTKAVRLPEGRLVDMFVFEPPAPMKLTVGGRCEDGKEIATIPFRIGEAEPQFNVKVSFDIAFDESTPAKGQSASKCLRNLHNFIRDEVLTPFELTFPK